MRRSNRIAVRIAASAVALALAATAPAASAQERRDAATADVAFSEAIALMKAGRHAEACPKLEESQRLDPGVGVLLYLGECHRRVGRTASAWVTFREAHEAANRAGQPDRARAARDRAAALEAHVPRIRLFVTPVGRAPRLEVRRDDELVGEALFDSALPVDPGEHRIVATAPGRVPFEVRVQARDGETIRIDIPVLVPIPSSPLRQGGPTADVARRPLPPPSPPSRSEGWTLPRTLGVVAGGVGLAALGVGAGFGLKTYSTWDEAEAHCSAAMRCDAVGLESARDASTFGTVSTVAFVSGGVLLVAGTVLALASPGTPRKEIGRRR